MPVIFRKDIGNATLILWRITESEETLSGLVGAHDSASAGRFANPGRRIEHLAWRAALRQVVPDAKVTYDEATNAPMLDNGLFVSAAHTRGMAAVVVSGARCAIDVEATGRDLSRTAPRFISDDERMLQASADPLFPAVVWCAKEALYKYSGRRELDFLGDIRITGADLSAGRLTGNVAGSTPAEINILEHDGYIVAYII